MTTIAGSLKALGIEATLEYVRAAVGVLRTLEQNITYQEFLREIGYLGKDVPWDVKYQQHIGNPLLGILAAIDREANGGHLTLNYGSAGERSNWKTRRGAVEEIPDRKRLITPDVVKKRPGR